MSDTAIYNSQEVAQARKDDQDLAQQKRFWVDYARLIAGREKQKTAMDPQGRVRYDTQIGDYEGQAEDCKAVPTFDVCPTVLNVARSDKARKQSLKAGLSAKAEFSGTSRTTIGRIGKKTAKRSLLSHLPCSSRELKRRRSILAACTAWLDWRQRPVGDNRHRRKVWTSRSKNGA